MENFKIYKHTFPNGKVYIGMTCQEVRHRWRDGNGYNNQDVMRRAIKKYGWGNIKHEVIFENLNQQEAENIEQKLIRELKANNKKFGYNLDNGGNHAGKMSKQTIEKMRNSLKNSPYNWLCDINNNVLQVFSGVNETARQTKIPAMVISRCCRGHQGHKCRRGYKFYLYVNNEIVIN